MEHINTLEEAKDYIATHYLFTEEHYPQLGKLSDEEKTIFIAKHCLLQVYQKMYEFLTESEKVLYDILPDVQYPLIVASGHIMVNILKLGELFTVDISMHAKIWNPKEGYIDILKFCSDVAAECTKHDRKNSYRQKNIQFAIEHMWEEFIKILNFEKLSFYEELYRIVPMLV
ncbi:MAG: hypothetical protein V4478_00995 [Patescibacteria group bacterium]